MNTRLIAILTLLAAGAFVACSQAAKPAGNPAADRGAAAVATADPGDNRSRAVSTGNPIPRQCKAVTPPAWPAANITSPSTIAFDDQNFYTIDGRRFFPLGFYDMPTDAAGLAQYKSEGFNIGLGGGGCCDGTDLQTQLDLLTAAQTAGVFLILTPLSNIGDLLTMTPARLAADFGPRDAIGSLFGWYTFDEPSLTGVSKTLAAGVHSVLSTIDATHLDTLTDAPVSNLDQYVNDCAAFMVDAYPSNWIPLSYVKEVMVEAEAATQGKKPVGGVMQAFSWNCVWGNDSSDYHPNAVEVRNMAWQFIIQGAKGLIPYSYDGTCTIHEQPDIWSAFLTDVAEMNALMGVLLADDFTLDLAPQTDFPTMFDYLVKREATATWALTISSSERTLAVNLDFSALGSDLCIVDYTTGDVFVQDAQGRVNVSYDAYQVRILEVLN
jgi:hypothetical protein